MGVSEVRFSLGAVRPEVRALLHTYGDVWQHDSASVGDAAVTSLVPCVSGRPAVVYVQDCAIRLDVRDAHVRAMERGFTQQLMDAHPDRGGTASALRRVVAQREAFRRDMAVEYARLGVPPLVAVPVAGMVPLHQTRCSCGRWFRAGLVSWGPQDRTRRVRRFCSQRCPSRRDMNRAPRLTSVDAACACGRAYQSRGGYSQFCSRWCTAYRAYRRARRQPLA